MSTVASVTDSQFPAQVLQSEKPVLVDFWATWCAPCRMIAPVVEEISDELGETVRVLKMDIDANPQVAMQFGIMSIPTLIIFKGGRPAERIVGYRSNLKTDLKQKLESLV
jgi:thioredoxin 1